MTGAARGEAALEAGARSFPLSAEQLALWFIDQAGTSRAQLVEGCQLRVRGDVDAQRLRDGIARVVRRHAALRIGCELVAGQPRQRVHSAVRCTVAEADFSALSPESAADESMRWSAEFSSAPFDLSIPPLWRAAVARLPGGQSLIVVAAHHLICDGWSLRLLFDEISEEYRTGGAEHVDPGGLAPYPQCVLDRDDAWRDDSAVAYWRSVLSDCKAPHIVVARPPVGSLLGNAQGAAIDVSVPAEESRLVRDVARRHCVTPFLVFAAVYAVTISRFAGESLIPLGSAFHGRVTPELKRVAGMFATTFVLRAELTGDPAFSELLTRMRETYRAARTYGNVILEHLSAGRNLSREPFFRHTISYHPASFAISDFAGMPAAMDLISRNGTHHELELHVRELDDSFALQLRFDPEAFDASSAQTVLGAFRELLVGLAGNPEQSVVSGCLVPHEVAGLRGARAGHGEPAPGRAPQAGGSLADRDRAGRTAFVAPRRPTERSLAGIWAELLGRPEVGVFDDFFDLGGHSLLASQVTARIREMFGVEIPVRAMLEDTVTVAGLAELIEYGQAAPPTRPPITPRAPGDEAVLSFEQERLWVMNQLTGGSAAYNIHGRRLLLGHLDVPALERSVRAILGRHEALRTRFPVVGGRPTQVVEDYREWRLAADDLSRNDDPHLTAHMLADSEASAPFDLGHGPLFRCKLLRLTEREHLLLITMHHIVADAWSMDLLRAELAELYRVGGDERRAALPPLPVQYRDYAVWQRRWMRGEVLDAYLAYWQKQLVNAPPMLNLPTIRRRAAIRDFAGGRIRSVLLADEAAGLRELCRQRDATMFMALLAGMAALLCRWSGQDDIVIGAPIGTRASREVEQLIGMFMNMLGLRVDVSGNPTFTDLLDRARKVALDAYSHQDMPFEQLVERLQPPRDPTRTPIFQVVLNMLTASDRREELSDVLIEALDAPATPSKFDLMLTVCDNGSALELELTYLAELYDPELMRTFLSQLCAFLRCAPDGQRVGILEFALSPAEEATEAPPSPGGTLASTA